jgi:hypothetical protein
MSQSQTWPAGIVGWMLALGLSGCDGSSSSENLPREAISGSVTVAGQPLAQGTIQFAPSSGALPTAGTAGIKDGKYSIPRSEGLVPGPYKVLISSFTEVADSPEPHGLPGKPSPPPKNLVPKKYNKSTTLTAEVKSGASNTFDFDLKK